ncbi:metal dependent phosphohydrolase [hydrocarbon metagenome]|uniref:Metal dependent phosphohydrolase n=1 Tax=hydrocarbon metagenome TaxID=938273 RepID=A0A0W8G476_9ZZZZ
MRGRHRGLGLEGAVDKEMGPVAGREAKDRFFAVHPLLIFPETLGTFKVYIKQAGKFVLYAGQGERFTPRHRMKLHDNGVAEVYILARERQNYQDYVERHLPRILADENVPVRERSRVLHSAATGIVQDVFDNKLPTGMTKREYSRILHFVGQAVQFLSRDEALKQIAALASHDYSVYSHSVQVFVYATAMLQAMRAEEELVVATGVGAMLHDLGKMAVDKAILHKPGPLTQEERRVVETHPVKGVALCMEMPLPSEVTACILLHHERINGSGYPGGIMGGDIPLHVRVLSAADVYDAMTTKRPYAEAFSPFEALRVMRDEMPGAFDVEVFRTLVMVLSGANIV